MSPDDPHHICHHTAAHLRQQLADQTRAYLERADADARIAAHIRHITQPGNPRKTIPIAELRDLIAAADQAQP